MEEDEEHAASSLLRSSTNAARRALDVIEQFLSSDSSSTLLMTAREVDVALLKLKASSRVAHAQAHAIKEEVRQGRAKTDALYLTLQNILEEKESLLLELHACLATDADAIRYCEPSAVVLKTSSTERQQQDEDLTPADPSNAYETQMLSRLKRVKTELAERTRLKNEVASLSEQKAQASLLAQKEKLELDVIPSLAKTIRLDKAITQVLNPSSSETTTTGEADASSLACLPRPLRLVFEQMKSSDVKGSFVTNLSIQQNDRILAELKNGLIEMTFCFHPARGVLVSCVRGADGFGFKPKFSENEEEMQGGAADVPIGFYAYKWTRIIGGMEEANAWVDLPGVLDEIVASLPTT